MTAPPPPAPPTSLGGLFTEFPGYKVASEADSERAIKEGLITCDANVLLNLYRYDDKSRTDFLDVLSSFSTRLFISHQALAEFWRNREDAILSRTKARDDALKVLSASEDDARRAVREWSKRLGLPPSESATALQAVEKGLSETIAYIEGYTTRQTAIDHRTTTGDPVLTALDTLLNGKVGAAYAPAILTAALATAEQRIKNQVPPGYLDSKKPMPDAAGDYLVWRQSLDAAQSRSSPSLVVITAEAKRDWWRQERGELRGPRPELTLEALREANTELFLMRPDTLLIHAQRAFGLSLSASTAAQVAASVEHAAPASDSWTPTAATMLLNRLKVEAPIQHSVVLAAAARGGFIPRDQVYRIAGYAADRTLRGFTRPCTRIAQDLKDDAILSESASDPMRAVYDPSFDSVNASGFQLTIDLVDILARARAPATADLVAARLVASPTLGDYSLFEVTGAGTLYWVRVSGSAMAQSYTYPIEAIVVQFAIERITNGPRPADSTIEPTLTSETAASIDQALAKRRLGL